MWRTIKAIFWAGLLFVGAILGASFLQANRAEVNVQFPWIGRESGESPLGLVMLAAIGIGVGIGLLVALFTSIGMTFYAARLKKEIRSLRKEVDALRNLPILEEEMDRTSDDQDEEDALESARSVELSAPGPVRGGSTAAAIGGDDEDDDDEEDEESAERARPDSIGGSFTSGTRKIDVP